MTAAETYATRVEAVLAQRTRLRGAQPPGDLFGGLPPDHPLLASDPQRPLGDNLAEIAAYVQPDDVLIDIGGGAGRYSLALASRCREVINVDPSPAMGAGFVATAKRAGIANARFIHSGWPMADPPVGDIALVNHVTYLTRDVVPFLNGLEASARRRVVLTVNDPPQGDCILIVDRRERVAATRGRVRDTGGLAGKTKEEDRRWPISRRVSRRTSPGSPTRAWSGASGIVCWIC